MSIVKQTLPYEILFRLGADGRIAGCHQKDLQVLVDDETGEVFSTKELDPIPISATGLGGVGEVINGVLVTENNSLRQALDVAMRELGDAQGKLLLREQTGAQLSNELSEEYIQVSESNGEFNAGAE